MELVCNSQSKNNRFKMWFGKKIMRLCGWKVVGTKPNSPKSIILGAPHTSNWDFILSLGIGMSTGISFSWVGKKSIFFFPFAWFMKRIGGIALDRAKSKNFVSQMIQEFSKKKSMYLAITPEGTRKQVEYWKTGFYYIAQEADITITLVFWDYKNRICGIGPTLKPTGDINADMEKIKTFYYETFPDYKKLYDEIKIKSSEINK